MASMHLLTFVISIAGFLALALATERQQEDLFGQALPSNATRVLRLSGWSALLVALYAIVQAQDWGMGLVSYSGHTSLAAGVVLGGLVAHARLRARR